MITPKNLIQHELIGLEVKISESTDGKVRGITGKVIDESQNMLTIRKPDGKEIRTAKKNSEFIFKLPDSAKVRVLGKLLQGDPIERLKKKQPRKW